MRTIHRDVVSALIFSSDGKLLMGQKDPTSGGVYPGCWHIPGGGVDEHETQAEALHREMLEEVGLDINHYKVRLIDDKGTGESQKILKTTGETVHCHMKFFVYRVDVDTPAIKAAIKPGDDLVTLAWIDAAKLTDYAVTPPSKALFERLGLW